MWNPFRYESMPPETYAVSVRCNNCTWAGVLAVPEGETAFDWLKKNNICPNCKCSGTLVQS